MEDKETKDEKHDSKQSRDALDLTSMFSSLSNSISKTFIINKESDIIVTEEKHNEQQSASKEQQKSSSIQLLKIPHYVFCDTKIIKTLSIPKINFSQLIVNNDELITSFKGVSKRYIKMAKGLEKIKIPDLNFHEIFSNLHLFSELAESIRIIYERTSYVIPNLSESIVVYAIKLLYESNWCPWILHYNPFSSLIEINKIVSNNRLGDKGKIKRIDAVIFSIMTGRTFNSIRKKWNQSNIDKTLKKLALEALRGYHNKNYGSTSIMLSALWEGIIKNIIGIDKKVTMRELKDLLKRFDCNGIKAFKTNQYYEIRLLETCDEKDKRDRDTPNRHGNQHGIFNGYPSKKSALNAILFTDYLISLSYNH